uniref:L-threonine 3-dehydrogenase, mitochondrial n=1 Tax=Percolomonas cosmopolitus TaxID=63605 RepID=A0A7S1PFK9_9EUKA
MFSPTRRSIRLLATARHSFQANHSLATFNELRRNQSSSSSKPSRVLITGCFGQIGSELVPALRERYGSENVVASDVRLPKDLNFLKEGPFEFLNIMDHRSLNRILDHYKIDAIIHNAAFVSALAEKRYEEALEMNSVGAHYMMNAALKHNCRLMIPSSIAAFGPTTPLDQTPDFTIQRPNSVYGVGKVYAELLGEYYAFRHKVDFRSLRYPGIISYKTLPGGGTTDYAVDIFYSAIRGEKYQCFLSEDVQLPMMYMPDCVNCTIKLLEADQAELKAQRTYNVTSFSITPRELHKAIQKHVPGFEIEYHVDPLRQSFAESWPNSLDDTNARANWGWQEEFDLDAMVKDMLDNLRQRIL